MHIFDVFTHSRDANVHRFEAVGMLPELHRAKGRGVCPGCNTRRMVETAAHMVEHVFPAVAVRQWVVVFPKRVRYFLDRDADCLKRVAGIAMREVQRATAGAKFGTS